MFQRPVIRYTLDMNFLKTFYVWAWVTALGIAKVMNKFVLAHPTDDYQLPDNISNNTSDVNNRSAQWERSGQ